MSKPAGRIIGQWAGVSVSAVLAGVGVVALRHALETPQPLKSVLPGEAHLYRWQRRSIFYKVLGPLDAPPLVLLHRLDIGASGHEMLHIMSPLAETYRVYALDLLGFGLSDRPGANYSAELYSTLCQDFLREVVQRPATLVASGLSCNYAVSVAANAPELCASLVLISPLALQGEQQPSPLKQYAEKPLVKALLYPLLSTHLSFLLARRLRRENREDFPQFYANTRQLGAEHAPMALLAGKLTGNTEQQFAALQQPVLMIWGTHALDSQHIVARLHKTAILANPARQVRKVELIQRAALAAHREQPESVIAVIRRWQEETEKEDLPAPQETPIFIRQNANQRAARTSAVQEKSEQTAAPQPTHVSPGVLEKPDETTQATLSAPPEAAESGEAAALAPSSLDEANVVAAPTQAEEASKLEVSGNSEVKGQEIVAYCVKCKKKRAMLNAREVIMKNRRPAMRGVCSVCGTRLNRIGAPS